MVSRRTRYRATRLRYVALCGMPCIEAKARYCGAGGETRYMIPRTLRSYGTSISRYPSVSRYMFSCEVHYNIPVRRRTCLLYCRYCIAGDETRYMILHTLDPMYPPEVGYLGSLAMWYPVGANSTPPTIVATCSPVLVIPPSHTTRCRGIPPSLGSYGTS